MSPQAAATFHLARARLAAGTAVAGHAGLRSSLRLPPQPQRGWWTTPAPRAADLASLLKPPAWGMDQLGERCDGDEEKMAGGEPALSQGLVEELAGYRPALPARASRHAAVAGPTHARRGAARACCTADVACASWRSRGLLGEGGNPADVFANREYVVRIQSEVIFHPLTPIVSYIRRETEVLPRERVRRTRRAECCSAHS